MIRKDGRRRPQRIVGSVRIQLAESASGRWLRPRLFDGKSIRVEGYLGVSRGLFVLNSSKELFEAGVTDETQVRISPIDLQRDVFNRYAYSWVSVTGEFRLRRTDGSTDDLLLGEMHAPLDVQSLRVPGPIPRATFGDVSVDLEDLK